MTFLFLVPNLSLLQQVGDFFLVPNLSYFSKNFKKNFEYQVGSGGQNFEFSGGGGGIKFELWWGVSSFFGGAGGIQN